MQKIWYCSPTSLSNASGKRTWFKWYQYTLYDACWFPSYPMPWLTDGTEWHNIFVECGPNLSYLIEFVDQETIQVNDPIFSQEAIKRFNEKINKQWQRITQNSDNKNSQT